MAFKPAKLQKVPESKVFTPTKEQVVNKDFVLRGNNVKIIAGAGTGKSSSLRYIASSIPEKVFLGLCFNAANAKESNEHPDKPDNIVYSTVHSLAYRKIVDFKFKNKLSFGLDWNDIPGDIVGMVCQEKDLIVELLPKFNNNYEKVCSYIDKQLTRSVLDCITYFCRSDSPSIATYSKRFLHARHVPQEDKVIEYISLNQETIDSLVKLICSYWINLTDITHPAKISHDVYLKLYQLGEYPIDEVYDVKTKSWIRPDVLCLDEAQDTNPVTEAIFASQVHQKILVGDPMQQLYAWRGAGDAMNNFKDFSVGYLTESFRFNSSIATLANKILESSGSDMRLIGSSTKEELSSRAILCRTNAAVIETLLDYLGTETKVYTSIDLKQVFSKLYHMNSCWFNEKPMYPCRELSNIVDRATLEKALEFSDELKRLNKLQVKLIKQGHTITSIKKELDKIIVKESSEADVTVSTGHAAKGLEYDTVRIHEDFVNLEDYDSVDEAVDAIWASEALHCLLYVMVTRARIACELPYYLQELQELQ
jgi:superfamily I DNA/RNA helicase